MAKHVNIELDKPRRLRFDINALADAEEELGTGIGKALQMRAGIREIRALLWAGLKWEERGLTLARAGSILQGHLNTGGSIEDIAGAIGEALQASGLVQQGDDEGNEEAETA